MKTPHNGAGLRKQTQKRASRKSETFLRTEKVLRPTKAYCIYIYKLNKSSPAVKDTVAVPGWLCTRVGTEAARLAKFNRRGTITQREGFSPHKIKDAVHAAFQQAR
ncbi:hypothetical protein Q7C36_018868 [Tachysurus vachellii]|uniref:Uncharacterized protein n=1 Tax=Tachysurus vachellii TaxID=175792 RepID=A0AA88S1E5_TACVA|nr:hypothetical protein Q7C36_018868 [Tachysurus vachellii]